MDWENKKRDREQGEVINPEDGASGTSGADVLPDMEVDITDWENKRFRYVL
jgi:hypothetical protein